MHCLCDPAFSNWNSRTFLDNAHVSLICSISKSPELSFYKPSLDKLQVRHCKQLNQNFLMINLIYFKFS